MEIIDNLSRRLYFMNKGDIAHSFNEIPPILNICLKKNHNILGKISIRNIIS